MTALNVLRHEVSLPPIVRNRDCVANIRPIVNRAGF